MDEAVVTDWTDWASAIAAALPLLIGAAALALGAGCD